jgi:hypothetical protein
MRLLACLMAGMSGVSAHDFDVSSPNVTRGVLNVKNIVIPAALAESPSRDSVESFISRGHTCNKSSIFAWVYSPNLLSKLNAMPMRESYAGKHVSLGQASAGGNTSGPNMPE